MRWYRPWKPNIRNGPPNRWQTGNDVRWAALTNPHLYEYLDSDKEPDRYVDGPRVIDAVQQLGQLTIHVPIQATMLTRSNGKNARSGSKEQEDLGDDARLEPPSDVDRPSDPPPGEPSRTPGPHGRKQRPMMREEWGKFADRHQREYDGLLKAFQELQASEPPQPPGPPRLRSIEPPPAPVPKRVPAWMEIDRLIQRLKRGEK